jgi:hypothetical protein
MSSRRREWTRPALLAGVVVLAVVTWPVAGATGAQEREIPWARHIGTAEAAVANGDVGAAERALHQAYLAALPNRGWEGIVDVADAYRRAGDVFGTRRHAWAKAREYYLVGLFRARQRGSLAGVFRTAEGFAAMGDREPVTMCLRVAESLAARLSDAGEREQARASIERLAQRLYAMDEPRER